MLFPIVSQNSGLLLAVNWPSTWRQFHIANFDRPILLFSWKVADGVLLTAQRLTSLACMCLSTVFVVQSLSR